VVERLKMIFERLAGDGNSLFDNERSFDRAERVAFNGVRRIGKLDVVVMLKLRQCLRRERPQLVEPLFFRGDRG